MKKALDFLTEEARREILQQGHKATGSLANSFEYEFSVSATGAKAVIIANDYGRAVDTGVASSNVPFSGTGQGGTSQYIQALIDWANVIKPSLSNREATSFAFAVAYTHKKEGIPSRGSYAFSENGRRKHWVEFGLESRQQDFEQELGLLELMEQQTAVLLTKLQR